MSRGKEVLEVLGEVLGALSVGHAEGFVGFLRVHTVDGEGADEEDADAGVGRLAQGHTAAEGLLDNSLERGVDE